MTSSSHQHTLTPPSSAPLPTPTLPQAPLRPGTRSTWAPGTIQMLLDVIGGSAVLRPSFSEGFPSNNQQPAPALRRRGVAAGCHGEVPVSNCSLTTVKILFVPDLNELSEQMFQLLEASVELLTLQRRSGGPVEGPDAGFHLKKGGGGRRPDAAARGQDDASDRQTDGGGLGALSLSFMLLPWSCRTWKCNQDTRDPIASAFTTLKVSEVQRDDRPRRL